MGCLVLLRFNKREKINLTFREPIFSGGGRYYWNCSGFGLNKGVNFNNSEIRLIFFSQPKYGYFELF